MCAMARQRRQLDSVDWCRRTGHDPSVSEGELKKAAEARARAAEAVIESTSPKRLVVSGPGTGKSFAFKKSLAKVIAEAGEGQGLALTFIKKLVPALQKDVGPLARVDTFHGYSKQLMHQHVAGLHKADLYPLLLDLLVEDLAITKHHETNKASIEEHLQTLDVSDGLVHDLMEIADSTVPFRSLTSSFACTNTSEATRDRFRRGRWS